MTTLCYPTGCVIESQRLGCALIWSSSANANNTNNAWNVNFNNGNDNWNNKNNGLAVRLVRSESNWNGNTDLA